jgi:tetratricopeptide (TPR) repeat protein
MHDSALARFYHSFLETQDSAGFITAIARRYEVATLMAMAQRGGTVRRRAAVLALGFLGNFSVNSIMGKALCDEDRGVRLIAESGIHTVWMSVGNAAQRQRLLMAERLIAAEQLRQATKIILNIRAQVPTFAETSRLLGVAHFAGGRVRAARSEFRQTIIDNPYQYQAAIGLGNTSARLGDAAGALRWFRRALRINPNLEMIRLHVAQLSKPSEQL